MISILTPLVGEKLEMRYLFSSIPNVATLLKNSPEALVVIRSTVPPGTTKKYQADLETFMSDKGMSQKTTVLFQPEFLRAATAEKDAQNPWHIVLGADKRTDIKGLIELYCKFVLRERITVLSIEEAELMKMFHNSYNANKISWMNQGALMCEKINEELGSSVDANKIFGTMAKTCEGLINPLYGTKVMHAYYGTCLPKDSAELARLEKHYGLTVPLFKSVVDVNNVVKKRDKEEILTGDHHMSFDKFATTSS